jgi:mono/diheme cytochrome c family protein
MEILRSARTKLLIASVPFLLVAAISFAANSGANMASAAAVTTESMMSDPGSDYVSYCTRCHGGDGRGQTAKGRQTHAGDLTKSRVSDAKGIRMITSGSGEMPAFKASMNAEQIKAVMAYVHGFRQ